MKTVLWILIAATATNHHIPSVQATSGAGKRNMRGPSTDSFCGVPLDKVESADRKRNKIEEMDDDESFTLPHTPKRHGNTDKPTGTPKCDESSLLTLSLDDGEEMTKTKETTPDENNNEEQNGEEKEDENPSSATSTLSSGDESGIRAAEDTIRDENNNNVNNNEEEFRKCNSVPSIIHSDENRMRIDCVGKMLLEKCRVSCKEKYQPNKQFVQCIWIEESLEMGWNLDGAKCDYNVDTVCRDKHNKKVEWFILYRFPDNPTYTDLTGNRADEENFTCGRSYIFMSDKSSDLDESSNQEEYEYHLRFPWRRGNDLNTSHPGNPLSNTLAPVSKRNVAENVGYAMYSDQYSYMKDDGIRDRPTVGVKYGHAKGVVMHDGAGHGVLLVHSQPHYPDIPGEGAVYSKFNGQTFMCISFDSGENLGIVTKYLKSLMPKVYARKEADEHGLNIEHEDPKELSSSEDGPSDSSFTSEVLTSSEGTNQFDLISKLEAVDIYSDVLVSKYGTNFDVQTWRSGNGMNQDREYVSSDDESHYDGANEDESHFDGANEDESLSDGANEGESLSDGANEGESLSDGANEDETTILEVQEMKYEDNMVSIKYKEGKDHSKWAVSREGASKHIFCISDLNRVNSQQKRGGGAICMENSRVAEAFRGLIVSYK